MARSPVLQRKGSQEGTTQQVTHGEGMFRGFQQADSLGPASNKSQVAWMMVPCAASLEPAAGGKAVGSGLWQAPVAIKHGGASHPHLANLQAKAHTQQQQGSDALGRSCTCPAHAFKALLGAPSLQPLPASQPPQLQPSFAATEEQLAGLACWPSLATSPPSSSTTRTSISSKGRPLLVTASSCSSTEGQGAREGQSVGRCGHAGIQGTEVLLQRALTL